jgi:hypothetical protein
MSFEQTSSIATRFANVKSILKPLIAVAGLPIIAAAAFFFANKQLEQRSVDAAREDLARQERGWAYFTTVRSIIESSCGVSSDEILSWSLEASGVHSLAEALRYYSGYASPYESDWAGVQKMGQEVTLAAQSAKNPVNHEVFYQKIDAFLQQQNPTYKQKRELYWEFKEYIKTNRYSFKESDVKIFNEYAKKLDSIKIASPYTECVARLYGTDTTDLWAVHQLDRNKVESPELYRLKPLTPKQIKATKKLPISVHGYNPQ